MFATILALLPKVGPLVAALPEFRRLISLAKEGLSSTDQATLDAAYKMAQEGSDRAHADLQALVAEKLG